MFKLILGMFFCSHCFLAWIDFWHLTGHAILAYGKEFVGCYNLNNLPKFWHQNIYTRKTKKKNMSIQSATDFAAFSHGRAD